MHTYDELKEDLIKMELKSTDSIMIHSSMKAIGEVVGGADTVIDVLMDYFSQGLVMMPTHTWAQMSNEYNIFDPETEPGCVGILPNLFMKREGVVRSLHPTHSIAAYGAVAGEYVKGEEKANTPCPPTGCFGRLRDIDAKILLVGVNHVKNTYIHSVEESYNVPERFTERQCVFKVKLSDGSYKDVPMYRHYNSKTAHISESYQKLYQAFLETGAAKEVVFGDAKCILCEARKIYEVTGRILERELNCLINREDIPKEWYTV